MPIFLSHMSAADFWRLVYNPDRTPGAPERRVPFTSSTCRLQDVESLSLDWLTTLLPSREGGRIHVLVHDGTCRGSSARIVPHVWGGSLPDFAFYKLSDDLHVASPEFVLLQLAKTCSLPQLVAYGNEICGRYAFDYREERGFRTRSEPLRSAEMLRRFWRSLKPGVIGAFNMERALRYISNGAESPMETVSHELLSLPYRVGGYGIAGLIMNEEIPLTPETQAVARRGDCRADIWIKKAKVDIEFQGKHDHTRPDAFERDRRRTNALSIMGYEVYELTDGQVKDLQAFEVIALEIAKRAGKYVRKEHRGAFPARLELRTQLFDWNKRQGRPA